MALSNVRALLLQLSSVKLSHMLTFRVFSEVRPVIVSVVKLFTERLIVSSFEHPLALKEVNKLLSAISVLSLANPETSREVSLLPETSRYSSSLQLLRTREDILLF